MILCYAHSKVLYVGQSHLFMVGDKGTSEVADEWNQSNLPKEMVNIPMILYYSIRRSRIMMHPINHNHQGPM
jgi:hypothetical protein